MFQNLKKGTREVVFFCRCDGESTYIIKYNHVGRTEYFMFINPVRHINFRAVTWLDAIAAKDFCVTDDPRRVRGWVVELVKMVLDAQLDFDAMHDGAAAGRPFLSFAEFPVKLS